LFHEPHRQFSQKMAINRRRGFSGNFIQPGKKSCGGKIFLSVASRFDRSVTWGVLAGRLLSQ
jgi:hypothetical protein